MVNNKIRLIIFFTAEGVDVYIVNKRVQNAVLGSGLKNDRIILFYFQSKPFNITLIQVYAPTTDAEEAEVDQFCEDLWCWRRLLRVPWTARRSNQSILKEISPGCSLEGLM